MGALNGVVALGVLMLSHDLALSSAQEASLRFGAQIQFMHGMATLACATFMNIGATGARRAPAFFLFGVLLYCVPIYAEVADFPQWLGVVRPLGIGAFAIGWLVMAWSAQDIDKP